MALTITTHGDIDRLVVASLPRAFVQKIFRHCWGKNNTPYFAANCFKGLLYFDERLARKYAEDLGLTWNGWLGADTYHHSVGPCYGPGLRLTVTADGQTTVLPDTGLTVKETRPHLAEFLAEQSEDEVLAVLGSVDRGEMVFTLPEMVGPFDPGRLVLTVERLIDCYSEEDVLVAMVYDGRPLAVAPGAIRGKGMLDPLLVSTGGALLDMYDFT